MFPVGCGLNAVSSFLAMAGKPIAIKSATNAASNATLNVFFISLLFPDPGTQPRIRGFPLRAIPLHRIILSEWIMPLS
jgi:hypothetical protein